MSLNLMHVVEISSCLLRRNGTMGLKASLAASAPISNAGLPV